jgi:tetratricopeptide (TPR) repeat protein
MIFAFTALVAASLAPVSAGSKADIVVVGRAIQNAKDSLAACLARHCRPDEDIDASLALAENQLIAGKYRNARETLLKSLSRNHDEAKAYPIPVSDLYRANGRVAAHLGIDADYYRSTWGIYRTLKHGLPDAKDRQYSALMEVAEMMATTRNHERARNYYDRIADQARKDGRPDIAAIAELRSVIRHLPPYMRERGVKRILSRLDPNLRAPLLEAKLALARMAYEKQDVTKGDAIVNDLASLKIKKPILVYAPSWELSAGPMAIGGTPAQYGHTNLAIAVGQAEGAGDAGGGGGRSAGAPGKVSGSFTGHGNTAFATNRMPLNVEDMWIDVGFHITADGKVSDLKIERSKGDIGWSKSLVRSIAGRRYTPADPASPFAYRRERYTYTSGLEEGAGTHSALHSPQPRVEYMDLSDLAEAN